MRSGFVLADDLCHICHRRVLGPSTFSGVKSFMSKASNWDLNQDPVFIFLCERGSRKHPGFHGELEVLVVA